jgi:hypothetical protein
LSQGFYPRALLSSLEKRWGEDCSMGQVQDLMPEILSVGSVARKELAQGVVHVVSKLLFSVRFQQEG